MHNLLTDPLIGVRTPSGERRVSLPELLALLAQGEIDSYTGLRPHQADPWHVFLVQLAASIQARHPAAALPTDPSYWREGLLDLADGLETAWSLVVDDVTKPAFLQHPWTSWEAEAPHYGVKTVRGKTVFDPKASSPDELDVLVTAKNHDVKMARFGPEAIDAWIYALLLLQTTSGFLGHGNYGIVRMNGGFASRPIVAWVESTHPSRRFMGEASRLRDLRARVCDEHHYQTRGIALTWLTPWDRRDHQHSLQQLEPWFIEAARPIRLRAPVSGAIIALGSTSRARQIGPKSVENGDVGDPWMPLNVQDKKKGRSALTLSAEGFTPQRLTDLLFEQGFELTPIQKPQPDDKPGWFVASCLVRGQGTTEGFHHIELSVSPKARIALLAKERRETLARLAQHLLTDANDVQKALGTALTVLAEGGPDKADFDRDAIKRWVERARADFGRHWKFTYFPTLWRGADEDFDGVRAAWQQTLVDQAQALLDAAVMRLPLPANRYWRAITHAQGALRGMIHKQGLPMPGANAPEHTDSLEDLAV